MEKNNYINALPITRICKGKMVKENITKGFKVT